MNQEEIKSAFARIQRRNLIASSVGIGIPALILLVLRDSIFESPDGLLLLFAPAIATVAYVQLVNWRCPVCNAWLGRFFTVRECPDCRAILRD
ncbi:MAG: hypothetical protein K8S54_07885 [Spirochaetia bacterium]|nr:hypothetical protein [Spirochaetia bacterium]